MKARPTSSLQRVVAYAVYYGLARHLPWSVRPAGRFGQAVRARVCANLFDSCGKKVNVEHGAYFGSGRGINVGNRSGIGLDCLILGSLTVGDDVMMGPRCVVIGLNHGMADVNRPMAEQGFEPQETVVIEDDVWIGANVTILPGKRIGRGSVVAAGSVVTSDVPPFNIVGGNPARRIRDRREMRSSARVSEGS